MEDWKQNLQLWKISFLQTVTKCHPSDMWQVEGHQCYPAYYALQCERKNGQLSGQPALHSSQLPIQLLLLICQSSSFHPDFILYILCSVQFSCFAHLSIISFHPFAAVVLYMEMSVFKVFLAAFQHICFAHLALIPFPSICCRIFFTDQSLSLQFFSAFQLNCFAPLALFLFPSSCCNVFFWQMEYLLDRKSLQFWDSIALLTCQVCL